MGGWEIGVKRGLKWESKRVGGLSSGVEGVDSG